VIRAVDLDDEAIVDESGVFAIGRNLDWLTIDTSTGQVAAGQSLDITLTLDATGLPDGVHEAVVRIDHSGGRVESVPVTFTVGRGSVGAELPARVALLGAQPNPFNPRTTIAFALPSEMDIHLDVYSAQGRLVRTLLTGRQASGRHHVVWDGRDASGRRAASGVYVYRLRTGSGTFSGKVALLK